MSQIAARFLFKKKHIFRNYRCANTQSGKTMCFSSCNVNMQVMCIHENVFRDVVFHGLTTHLPFHFREVPDFLFLWAESHPSLKGFKSMTLSLLKMEDSSLQGLSPSPCLFTIDERKKHNFHC